MQKRSFCLLISTGIFLFFSTQSKASLSPYHSYPPAVMHQLPHGETPGWEKPLWLDLEVQQANFWNLPTRFNHRESGKQLSYFNDFEQTLLLIEMGSQLTDSQALSLEMPFIFRSGGGMDHFISEFHKVFGFIDFNRQLYPEYQNIFSVKVDGADKIQTQLNGIGNIKLKYKNWISKNSHCTTCGWALHFQLKIPLENGIRGLSSGYFDGSLLIHNGFSVTSGFNIFLSTGVSTTFMNKVFEEWPLYKLQYMADLASTISIGAGWELVLSAQLYSPYMNKNNLEYTDPETDGTLAAMNKVSSALNALTEWRAYELVGFKKGGFTIYIQEDWGLGSLNGSRGGLYINGAPDVAIGIKWSNQF